MCCCAVEAAGEPGLGHPLLPAHLRSLETPAGPCPSVLAVAGTQGVARTGHELLAGISAHVQGQEPSTTGRTQEGCRDSDCQKGFSGHSTEFPGALSPPVRVRGSAGASCRPGGNSGSPKQGPATGRRGTPNCLASANLWPREVNGVGSPMTQACSEQREV